MQFSCIMSESDVPVVSDVKVCSWMLVLDRCCSLNVDLKDEQKLFPCFTLW